MEKKCFKCGEIKLVSEFNKNKRKKDGLQSNCRDCTKTYLKEHYQKNKEYYNNKRDNHKNKVKDFIYELKKNSKCERCSESDVACLDFHHVGEKEFNISVAVAESYSIGRIKKELKKCIILCANCHRKLHYYER